MLDQSVTTIHDAFLKGFTQHVAPVPGAAPDLLTDFFEERLLATTCRCL